MHCWIIFDATAEKATIYKCTNFQHHLSLLLSAASTHTTKQYPATNPQPTSALTTWLRKAFWSRRDISAIYRDRIDKYIFLKYIGNISGLAALGTRSACKFLKVASTTGDAHLFPHSALQFSSDQFTATDWNAELGRMHFPEWRNLSPVSQSVRPTLPGWNGGGWTKTHILAMMTIPIVYFQLLSRI